MGSLTTPTDLLAIDRARLRAMVQRASGVRASVRLEAATDILAHLAPFATLTRQLIQHPCVHLTDRYTAKALDRGIALLLEAGVVRRASRRPGRGGGWVYAVDVGALPPPPRYA